MGVCSSKVLTDLSDKGDILGCAVKESERRVEGHGLYHDFGGVRTWEKLARRHVSLEQLPKPRKVKAKDFTVSTALRYRMDKALQGFGTCCKIAMDDQRRKRFGAGAAVECIVDPTAADASAQIEAGIKSMIGNGQGEVKFEFTAPFIHMQLEDDLPQNLPESVVYEIIVGGRVCGTIRSAGSKKAEAMAGISGALNPESAVVSFHLSGDYVVGPTAFECEFHVHGGPELDGLLCHRQSSMSSIVEYLRKHWQKKARKDPDSWQVLFVHVQEPSDPRPVDDTVHSKVGKHKCLDHFHWLQASPEPVSSSHIADSANDYEATTSEGLSSDTVMESSLEEAFQQEEGAGAESIDRAGMPISGTTAFTSIQLPIDQGANCDESTASNLISSDRLLESSLEEAIPQAEGSGAESIDAASMPINRPTASTSTQLPKDIVHSQVGMQTCLKHYCLPQRASELVDNAKMVQSASCDEVSTSEGVGSETSMQSSLEKALPQAQGSGAESIGVAGMLIEGSTTSTSAQLSMVQSASYDEETRSEGLRKETVIEVCHEEALPQAQGYGAESIGTTVKPIDHPISLTATQLPMAHVASYDEAATSEGLRSESLIDSSLEEAMLQAQGSEVESMGGMRMPFDLSTTSISAQLRENNVQDEAPQSSTIVEKTVSNLIDLRVHDPTSAHRQDLHPHEATPDKDVMQLSWISAASEGSQEGTSKQIASEALSLIAKIDEGQDVVHGAYRAVGRYFARGKQIYAWPSFLESEPELVDFAKRGIASERALINAGLPSKLLDGKWETLGVHHEAWTQHLGQHQLAKGGKNRVDHKAHTEYNRVMPVFKKLLEFNHIRNAVFQHMWDRISASADEFAHAALAEPLAPKFLLLLDYEDVRRRIVKEDRFVQSILKQTFTHTEYYADMPVFKKLIEFNHIRNAVFQPMWDSISASTNALAHAALAVPLAPKLLLLLDYEDVRRRIADEDRFVQSILKKIFKEEAYSAINVLRKLTDFDETWQAIQRAGLVRRLLKLDKISLDFLNIIVEHAYGRKALEQTDLISKLLQKALDEQDTAAIMLLQKLAGPTYSDNFPGLGDALVRLLEDGPKDGPGRKKTEKALNILRGE